MNSARLKYIDAFRGLSVLSVVLFHYTDRVPYSALHYEAPVLPGLWAWGWVGVYWFFIISGFFMLTSVEKVVDGVSFLAKRIARIYPAYFCAIILLLVFMSLVAPARYTPWDYTAGLPSIPDLIANFLFATDLGFEFVDGAFWTLQVELKFYAFLAVIFFWFSRKNAHSSVMVVSAAAAGLGILWLVYPIVLAPVLPPFGATLSHAVLKRALLAPYLPFFSLGMLLAYFARSRDRLALVAGCAMFVVTMFVVSTLSQEKPYAYENTVATVIVYGAVVLALVGTILTDTARAPKVVDVILAPLVRIGVVSYTWYLVHQDMGLAAIYHLNAILPDWLSLLVTIAFTYALGELLTRTVEWRFRSRFEAAVIGVAHYFRLKVMTPVLSLRK